MQQGSLAAHVDEERRTAYESRSFGAVIGAAPATTQTPLRHGAGGGMRARVKFGGGGGGSDMEALHEAVTTARVSKLTSCLSISSPLRPRTSYRERVA